MKVVEKDRVISGMLSDELKRCEEMVEGLERFLADLPKGILSERKKRYKDREYSYYYLKYREGASVVNKHIPKKDVQELLNKLDMRRKYEKELRAYRNKISYLNKILVGRKRGRRASDLSPA